MYTMKESVAVAKEADAKKRVSPTRSDNSIHRVRDDPEMQLGSLRGVIGNIRRDGGTPSVESIATHLSGMHTAQHAPALLALQQTHGNRYVQRVVAGIQAKLVVGQPGDIYEQEADSVADEVMRMPEPEMQRQAEEGEGEEEKLQTKPLAGRITPLMQRQAEEEEEEKTLQTKRPTDKTPKITSNLEAHINTMLGGDQLLAKSVRAFFEPRFGYDFSQVRIHADSKAAETARMLQARAFTIGRNIVFGKGEYAPSTLTGRQLLAHELTHVVQQNPVHLPTRSQAVVNQIAKKPNDTLPYASSIQASHSISHNVHCNTVQLYQDCTRHNPDVSEPDNLITTARDAAIPIVTQAREKANRIREGRGGSIDTAALNSIFNNPNAQQKQHIWEIYNNISGWLPDLESFICNSRSVCESDGDEGGEFTYAYLGQCRGTIVHICPSFFDAIGPHQKALTVIHEGAHRFGVCEQPERYYGETGFPPTNAADVCADSYAYFVDQVALERAGRETLEERPVTGRR